VELGRRRSFRFVVLFLPLFPLNNQTNQKTLLGDDPHLPFQAYTPSWVDSTHSMDVDSSSGVLDVSGEERGRDGAFDGFGPTGSPTHCGQTMKARIAGAVVKAPKALLLDEPLGEYIWLLFLAFFFPPFAVQFMLPRFPSFLPFSRSSLSISSSPFFPP